MTRKYTRIDPTIINLAIQELKDQQKKITLQAIAEVTGYSLPSLYGYPGLQQYRARGPRHGHAAPNPISKPSSATVELEPSVASYMSYMLDNYFLKPEERADVFIAMQEEIKDFNAKLWGQAINLLIAQKKIKETLNKGKWISQVSEPCEAPTEKTSPEVKHPKVEPYFVMLGAEVHQVSTMEEAEQVAKELLIKANFQGEAVILKPLRRLQAQLQIVEKALA